uniref:VWFA domain-containing protein n=1 Tax=Alexandrium catenella TaxID=2925 RepID=A0A7S1SDR6_ALECA|mmetsp:Transcript_97102/g.258031  ORF Transcript_97102/g.258031 Transcript_97102/m.258031 type:complete len:299 (+) Transcript_97102:68-964(+)
MAAGGMGRKERKKLDGVLLRQLGISICEVSDLEKLATWDIVIIVDDSGSMSRKAVPREKRKPGVEYPTRWDELRGTLDKLISIAMCLDADGVDIHFLNMGSLAQVKSLEDKQLQAFLSRGPQSGTPLTETVGRATAGLQASKKYLVVILTDGEPSGGRERFKATVRQVIARGNVVFQIMACTGDDEEVAWLNEFDAEFAEVDVTDDYATEREEVLRTQRYKEFSKADWVIKALLGPVDRRFDCLDEAQQPAGLTAPPVVAESKSSAAAAEGGLGVGGAPAGLIEEETRSNQCGACSIS